MFDMYFPNHMAIKFNYAYIFFCKDITDFNIGYIKKRETSWG